MRSREVKRKRERERERCIYIYEKKWEEESFPAEKKLRGGEKRENLPNEATPPKEMKNCWNPTETEREELSRLKEEKANRESSLFLHHKTERGKRL